MGNAENSPSSNVFQNSAEISQKILGSFIKIKVLEGSREYSSRIFPGKKPIAEYKTMKKTITEQFF